MIREPANQDDCEVIDGKVVAWCAYARRRLGRLNNSEDLPDAYANPAVRIDDSFPPVRLPKLGNVILRAMSTEHPCQRRYGFGDSLSCRVGPVSRQDMKNALEWIANADRYEKTWCDVSW